MSRTGSVGRFCASISARRSVRVRSRSIIQLSRIESLELTLHVGELGECPIGATPDECLPGPDDAIGVSRSGVASRTSSSPPKGLAILDPPGHPGIAGTIPLRRRAKEKHGQVVAEWCDAHSVRIVHISC